MRDPTEAKKTLVDRLNDANRFLSPRFGLDKPLTIEWDEGSEELADEILEAPPPNEIEEAKSFNRQIMVGVRYTHPSGETHYEGVPIWLDDFGIANSVCFELYRVANPQIHQDHNFDATRRKSIFVQYLLTVYRSLRHIIGAVSGFAYVASKGKDVSAEYEIQRQREAANMAAIDMEISASEGKVANKGIVIEGGVELQIARQLFAKKGDSVIPEIVHLNLKDARDYILQNTGINIGNPPRSYLGHVQPPPKSVS